MDIGPLNCNHKVPHVYRDVLDQIDELRGEVALLRQRQGQQMTQWEAVVAEQQRHCCDLASVYQQLRELVGGIPKTRLGVEGEGLFGPQQKNNTLFLEVRDILLDFKDYIERGRSLTNQRLEDMQNSIWEMKKALEEETHHRKLKEERLRRLEERHEQLVQLVAAAASTSDLDAVRTTLDELVKSKRSDVSVASSQQPENVGEKIADCMEKCQTLRVERERAEGRLEALCRGNRQLMESNLQLLQQRVESLSEELRAHKASTSAGDPSGETYTAHKMNDIIASLESRLLECVETTAGQLDAKHVQFVERMMDSAKKAAEVAEGLPKRVNLLQDEVASIQDAIQRHGEALSDQFLEGPLYSAFEEVRGWLQDVERHSVKRGEFNEAMANFDEKLASLRREFLIGGSVEHVSDESLDVDGVAGGTRFKMVMSQ